MSVPSTAAFAHYCQVIYELDEDDIAVIQARIAERLGVSRPAVSEMIRRLEGAGLASTKGGQVNLTKSGKQLATLAVRRHRIAERFLTDVLHISWADAHEEADKWSGVISDRVEAALLELLEDPTTCPHGNPIPGSDYQAPGAVALADVPVGGGFVVTRIPEELEFSPGLLQFLEASHIVPGNTGMVMAQSPDGTLTVEVAGRSVGLGMFASRRILVAAG